MFTLKDDEALDLLVERVKFWIKSPEILANKIYDNRG